MTSPPRPSYQPLQYSAPGQSYAPPVYAPMLTATTAPPPPPPPRAPPPMAPPAPQRRNRNAANPAIGPDPPPVADF